MPLPMMSSGGYPFPPGPSGPNTIQPRRASGGMPLSYERPVAALPLRKSPSPRRYGPYEDPAPRSAPPYRDGYSGYRQNPYRPDSSTYRSPSPDRRYDSPRDRDADGYTWDRSAPWQPSNKAPWPDRRALTLSPTASVMSRDRVRSGPTRLFEPSDAWKQTQGDRPITIQSPKSGSVERFADRIRDFRESTPERAVRGRSPPYFVRSDRYRPDQNIHGNGRKDSYRPNYDDSHSGRSTYRKGSGDHFSPRRRGSNDSISSSRSSRSAASRSRSRSRSRSASRSRSSPRRDRHSLSPPSGSARHTKSRSASRSSIASTQAPDNPPSRHVSPVSLPELNNSPPAANGVHPLTSPMTLKSHLLTSPKPVSSWSTALTAGGARSPSPIPGISIGRALHSDGQRDTAAEGGSQQPLVESLDSVPGLGIALRNLDIDLPPCDPQVQEQSEDLSSSPLSEEKREVGSAMTGTVNQSKSTMPTWDVVPTVPESSPPALGLPPALPSLVTLRTEPAAELVLEPAEPTSEPIAEPMPEPAAELVQEPVTELVPEPVDEPFPAPSAEPALAPVAEFISAPTSEPASAPHVEPAPISAPSPPPQVLDTAPHPSVDYVFEDIPRLADAKSIEDALRSVVMIRLLRDTQTREEFVNPILKENSERAKNWDIDSSRQLSDIDSFKAQAELIEEVSAQRFKQGIDDPFLSAKSWLTARFERRRSALNAKKDQLQLEYQTLHQRWRRHCDILSQQVRPVELPEAVPVSGRTTRRSTAAGDTVRSDLEMEQIIASLGYDEATDPNQLSVRNLATIPDMISVTGETQYTFDDTNHLVDNPSEYYAPYTGIHDWTEEEKELFLDKYAAFPKQFGTIAAFLPNKTPSQCVDYYYLHKKKLIDFRRVVSRFAPNKRRRRGTGKQKGNGLLSDIRQHDAEVNRDSDDSPSYTGRATRGRRTVPPETRKPSGRRNAVHLEDTPTATPTPEPEGRPKRRRAAVSSRSVLFQEDVDDDTDGEPKKKKRGRKPKSTAAVLDDFATPLPTPPPTDVDIDQSFPDPAQLWSSDDKALFLALLAQHGENFRRIAVAMPNKTSVQVAEYFKSNYAELDLVSVLPKALLTNGAVNGDASISGRTTPLDMTLSSPPSPSASTIVLQETISTDATAVNDSESAETTATAPTQGEGAEKKMASVLDPNAMWDSMDPGSRAQSSSPGEPSRQASSGPEASDPSAISDSGPTSVSRPAPMASLTRESSVVEVGPSFTRG
ncbi:hypothetical protein C8R47DRAFT_715927 [Mycena vitilis]|nr:hypothetical protein C8R47DRAFT_715927 [Mycena vitilis]